LHCLPIFILRHSQYKACIRFLKFTFWIQLFWGSNQDSKFLLTFLYLFLFRPEYHWDLITRFSKENCLFESICQLIFFARINLKSRKIWIFTVWLKNIAWWNCLSSSWNQSTSHELTWNWPFSRELVTFR